MSHTIENRSPLSVAGGSSTPKADRVRRVIGPVWNVRGKKMAFHVFLRLLSFIFWCGLIAIRPAGALPAGPGIEIMPAQFAQNGQLNYVVVDENEETNTNFLEQQPVLVRVPQRQAEYVVPQRQERPLQIQQRVQSVPQLEADILTPYLACSDCQDCHDLRRHWLRPAHRCCEQRRCCSDEGSIHPVQS
uniref:Uncharacterized protein n=1 Tax=Anopheles merus TaxID=30066 RepID=A0A182VN48_ANOME